jgi:hypothetical protein
LADQAVKVSEQGMLQRNTDSSQVSHQMPPSWGYLAIS